MSPEAIRRSRRGLTCLLLPSTAGCMFCGFWSFVFQGNTCTGTGSAIYHFATICNSEGHQALFYLISLIAFGLIFVISQFPPERNRWFLVVAIFVAYCLLAYLIIDLAGDNTPHIPSGANLG